MWMSLPNLAGWLLRPWLTDENLNEPYGRENWAWRLLRWLMHRALPELREMRSAR